jgi:uncharacterized protein YkwD
MKNIVVSILMVFVTVFGFGQEAYRLTLDQVKKLEAMKTKTYNYADIESEFLTVINKYRTDNNIKVVERDSSLDNFVLSQAQYNMKNRLNGHDSEMSAQDRFKSFKLYRILGENALRSGYSFCFIDGNEFTIAENVFELWKRSAGHNRIMLLSDATKIGISIVENEKREIFAVMVLAK